MQTATHFPSHMHAALLLASPGSERSNVANAETNALFAQIGKSANRCAATSSSSSCVEPLDINRRGQVASQTAVDAAGHRSQQQHADQGRGSRDGGCLEPWTAAEPSKQKSKQAVRPSMRPSVCASARHHPSLSAYNVNGLLESNASQSLRCCCCCLLCSAASRGVSLKMEN